MTAKNSDEPIMTNREILRDIHSKTTEMYGVVMGNPNAKQDGLVHKVARHGDYIRSDRRFKWAVASLLFGGTGSFMAWIKSHIGL